MDETIESVESVESVEPETMDVMDTELVPEDTDLACPETEQSEEAVEPETTDSKSPLLAAGVGGLAVAAIVVAGVKIHDAVAKHGGFRNAREDWKASRAARKAAREVGRKAEREYYEMHKPADTIAVDAQVIDDQEK